MVWPCPPSRLLTFQAWPDVHAYAPDPGVKARLPTPSIQAPQASDIKDLNFAGRAKNIQVCNAEHLNMCNTVTVLLETFFGACLNELINAVHAPVLHKETSVEFQPGE